MLHININNYTSDTPPQLLKCNISNISVRMISFKWSFQWLFNVYINEEIFLLLGFTYFSLERIEKLYLCLLKFCFNVLGMLLIA
ncbi:hypothetical protein H8356DRAFT_1344963 [Neocallimastix lanati (nom. inval.)]|nr:hypothetical protein H8356DRAFT_1344963 [Neocallimastix sp. JGI-2020a]